MRFYKAKIILLTSILVVGFLGTPARADSLQLEVAEDHTTGYNRALFKHWIDADKNGCDTRAEVLIEEAIVKPKIGAKCKLTGGKWLSVYDGKILTNSSLLDVDHMVPLAEAWRSGAWKWTAAQRQAYANDLDNSEALIAVTLSTNRSKGDKDPSLWMPAYEKCAYLKNWISIKIKYSLSADTKELDWINSLSISCGISNSTKSPQLPTNPPAPKSTPMLISQPVDLTDNVCPRIVKISLDKQNLLMNEKTLLKIVYEDDKNSFDTIKSGNSMWIKPMNVGTLQGGNYGLSNFKIIKSEKINGVVIEEIEAQLLAPSAPGIWKFAFLSVWDKGGNRISFEARYQLCGTGGYISAPEYNLDLNVS